VKELEVTAKTIDEAVQIALEELGVDEDQVEVVVLKKGKVGVLGMGVEEAKISVRILGKRQEKDDIEKTAKAVLESLIKCMGIEAEVHANKDYDNELPMTLDIEGDDLGVLIGRRGQALASLQYIVRLVVAEKLKIWVPINVDVAGYKKRRYESLKNLAFRLADQVKASKHSINLEPMPADERRIIHLALTDHPDVATQSMGDGENRKVVVLLRKR
jgi:spoIIIJ-associated protein